MNVNQAHLDMLMEAVNASPYFKLLGMEIQELGFQTAVVKLEIGGKHLNPFGTVHGGVYASLIDTAAYWAAYYDQEESAGFTSVDVSVTNLAMSATGTLIAKAKAIKEGKSICLCEASIYDEQEHLVAHGTSKLLMLHGKQSVADVIKMMGCGDLPPKYLG